MTAVAIQKKEEVLALLKSGLRLTDIAPRIGVCRDAISKALKNDPEYREAIEQSFDARLDKAEDAIESAADNVDVSRARAYHEALKWRAGVEVDKFRPKQDQAAMAIQVIIAPNGVAEMPNVAVRSVDSPDYVKSADAPQITQVVDSKG